MANRIVDVIYRLKDQFTNQVGKITGGYRRMGDEAEKAGKRTSAAFTSAGAAINRLTSLAGRVAGAIGVGLGLGAAAQSVKQFTNEADRLEKIGQKLGYTAEDLQRVGYAAERNGISFDTMAVAVQRATRRIAEVASTGKGEAAPALEALGLSASELSKLNLEGKMAKLADAFAGVSDQGERIRLAFKLFDTEGVDMVRVLQEGSVAFKELTQRAGEFGDVIGDEATKAAADLNDRLADVQKRWDGLTLGPKVNFVGNLNNILKATGNYLSDQERITDEINGAYEERMILLRRIAELEAVGGGDATYFKQRLDQVTRTIKALQDEGIALQKIAAEREKEADVNKAASAARAKLAGKREENIQKLEEEVKKTGEALRKETAEWEKAKRDQLAIQQEFADLVANVQAPDDQNLTSLDVQTKRLEAIRALAAGDAAAAIAAAQQGATMLEKLKSQGGEAGYVLAFLAKQLQAVATEASGKNTQAELIDVQDAEAAKNRVEQALAGIKAISLDVDDASLELIGRRVEAMMRDATATGLRAAFAGFQPGQNLAPLINDAVSKRGSK